MILRSIQRLAKLALILGLALASPGQARDLTGSLLLRHSAPLPDGLQAEVQVWAETGETAHLALSPKGQPPFAFRLTVPDSALLVQAMIRAPTGQRWVSRYSRVPAGKEDRHISDLLLDPIANIGFSATLACGPALVQIGFSGQEAFALRQPLAQADILAQMKSVGAKRNTIFSDGRSPPTTLDVTGPLPRLVWAGKPLPPCLAMPDPSRSTVTLHGQDDAWSGRISAQGETSGLAITLGNGPETVSRHALPRVSNNSVQWTSPGPLALSLIPGPCRLSGHRSPYPALVDAEVNGKRLFGCAGEPADLLQGDWQVLILNGQRLAAGQSVTLSVRGENLSATAGCNRLTGQIPQTGADTGPRLNLTAQTRMACPDQTAQTEATVLAAFAASTGHDMDQDGRLLVLAGDKTVAILRRP